MLKNKFRKSISTILTLVFTGATLHCGAANIVPIRGGNVAVPPSVPVTKTSTDFKNPDGGFSLQSMKSKIDEVINPQKGKAEPREENPSGTCGDNCSWSLNTETGELTISGTGRMKEYSVPWEKYKSSIKSVNIANGITSIGEYAFSKCSVLTSVTIPDSVTSIGKGAFLYSDALTNISVGNDNLKYKSIDGVLFNKEIKTLISYPAGNSRTSYDIPDSVTLITDYAFSHCNALTSVTIGISVTSIGKNAFMGCSALTNITIPDSVTSIGEYAFENCSALQAINVNADNLKYKSINGVLFDKEIKTLIQYPTGNSTTSYDIPNSVTSIENAAFFKCSSLTSVTIGNSVTSIGGSAFENCKALTSINVGNDNLNYKSIDGILFNKMGTNLIQYPSGITKASYDIPGSVTSIGLGAFSHCASLVSVTIGNSVTSVESYAFDGCIALSQVCYLGTANPGKSSGEVFDGCGKLINVSVTENYTDSKFCGKSISKDGTCVADYSSSSSEIQSSSVSENEMPLIVIDENGTKTNSIIDMNLLLTKDINLEKGKKQEVLSKCAFKNNQKNNFAVVSIISDSDSDFKAYISYDDNDIDTIKSNNGELTFLIPSDKDFSLSLKSKQEDMNCQLGILGLGINTSKEDFPMELTCGSSESNISSEDTKTISSGNIVSPVAKSLVSIALLMMGLLRR